MAINTGIFIPGTSFSPEEITMLVGNQIPALNKGAYDDKLGVKQRILVVESDEAKAALQHLLRSESTFDIPLMAAQRRIPAEVQRVMSTNARILTNRVITVKEYRQQQTTGYNFNKLYIQAQGQALGAESFTVSYQKSPPFKTAAKAGLLAGGITAAVCGLTGASSSTALKAGTAVGAAVFGAIFINEELEPDEQPYSVSCKKMARLIANSGLYCQDVRILSYNSGDRSLPQHMNNPESLRIARTRPDNLRALDEALAAGLQAHPAAAGFNTVSGYQGASGLNDTATHLIRRSVRGNESIRQKDARVHTVIIRP